MTNEEAIKILKTELEVRSDGYYDHLQSGGNGDCEEEASLNALQLAIELLEKQIPKKPKATYDWYTLIQWECPECLGVIDSPTFMDYSVEKYPFCPYCGQKLDWSVVE